MTPELPKYALNVAAQLVGLSPRTLRLYEEAGLIAPARTGGHQQRLYTDQDLRWLWCIRDMIHEEGLTVTAIRRLLDVIPCWEIRHCGAETARACEPGLSIPRRAEARQAPPPAEEAVGTEAPAAEEPTPQAVEIRIIYGVEELGAIMHCSRCLAAERTARRVALRHPGRVRVLKWSLLAPETAGYGALLPPTVVVDDEVVSAGKGVSEAKLAAVVERHLAALEHDGPV